MAEAEAEPIQSGGQRAMDVCRAWQVWTMNHPQSDLCDFASHSDTVVFEQQHQRSRHVPRRMHTLCRLTADNQADADVQSRVARRAAPRAWCSWSWWACAPGRRLRGGMTGRQRRRWRAQRERLPHRGTTPTPQSGRCAGRVRASRTRRRPGRRPLWCQGRGKGFGGRGPTHRPTCIAAQ